MLTNYVKVLVSDDIVALIKWTGLVMILVMVIFASCVAFGYWLSQKRGDVWERLPPDQGESDAGQGHVTPVTRDAQSQAEGVVDEEPCSTLALPHPTAAVETGVVYFSLYGECYHVSRNCPGLNPTRYELRTRRLCLICRRDAGRG